MRDEQCYDELHELENKINELETKKKMNKVLKGIICIVSAIVFLVIMFLVMCGVSFLLDNASNTVQHEWLIDRIENELIER